MNGLENASEGESERRHTMTRTNTTASIVAAFAIGLTGLTGCQRSAEQERERIAEAQREAERKIEEAQRESTTKITSAQAEVDRKVAEANADFDRNRSDYQTRMNKELEEVDRKIERLEAGPRPPRATKAELDAALLDIPRAGSRCARA